MNKKSTYWILLVIWLGIIFILSSIPSLSVESLGYWDLILRKFAHFVEFAILAIILFKAFDITTKEKPVKLFMAVLFLSIFYASTDELHQMYVPGRNGNLVDIGIDSLGVLFGTIIYYFYKTKYKQKQI